jgi:dihydroorotase
MSDYLLIQGGHVIDPGTGTDIVGGVLITDGKIVWVGTGELPQSDCAVLNAEGLVVCPGFVDMHTHLRQPGFEDSETIATGTLAAARGGFTTVCCMPNTSPPLDNEGILNYVRTIAAMEGVVRVLPIGCVTRGRKGEELVDMNELEMAGAVAFSDDGSPVSSPDIMRRALEYSRDFKRPIIDHCENLFLTQGGQVNEGIVSLELGLRGIPPNAEELIVQRDLELARETGGQLQRSIHRYGPAKIIKPCSRVLSTALSTSLLPTMHHMLQH